MKYNDIHRVTQEQTSETYFVVKRDSLWGMFDRQGREIIPIIHRSTYMPFIDDELFERGWVKIGGELKTREGLFNIHTGVTIAPQYKDIFPLGNAIKVTLPESHFYELLDTEGNILPGGPYLEISPYDDLFIAKKEGGNYGVVDANGKVLVPFVYNGLYYATPRLFLAQKDGRSFYVNREGREYIMD